MDTTDSIFPTYEGKPIIPSIHSQRELDDLGLDLWSIKEVLEIGYDCQKGKRAENIIERCIEKSNKTLRVVVALVDFNSGKSFWRLIHVGKSSKH